MSTTYAADGARERDRRKKTATTAATAITATPPTVPPTIAPVFELLPLEGEDVDEEDDADSEDAAGDNGDGVVVAGKFVGFGDDPVLVPVGPKPVLVVEPPINSPGPISGEPRTNLDGRSKS